ncbi:UDP-3-O-(3-hydroxymyristoyl)glucosamine N-acyltransferase [Chelatococcus sp. SYSU_G07232]|uniref:UDP-3-O-acylglucosamine N-acyltransferase n=1 Tax=Chelatococcus albus TaxID=3047466 RepID=A0ABT7ABM2_9HYPH|nr:UDP-3-O-(3-hydroxymyristoyl)glucosamine N-acyltransferase [Chelatococcus sp. SYSU_G07232]MDJ1156777.1 UDP-3-O-(3-hydroxymyristoyl)glucosamine N-acyltransferase [Chelatococcus sp. SYSU_G07232]
MSDPVFFPRAATPTLGEIAALAGVSLPDGVDPHIAITGAASVERADRGDLAYMDNPRYGEALAATRATACLVSKRFAAKVPATTVAIVTPQPYKVFAAVLATMYPAAVRPGSSFDATGVSPGAYVHPQARLEAGVTVDPGAVVGPGVEIGTGTIIGANAVIGPQVRIGRGASIGANVSIHNALIGNRVILHGGVRVGQDGFGFAMSGQGHTKVPQIGRVIIQDDVEIGANSTIDRGASRDTVIGEGTKIDNLVQIGHNVVIGRHCVIVSQVGIAGSVTIEDFVVLGGQVGVVGHLRIGAGAQIAGSSNVASDVPPGARWGGTPAKPMREWFRELTLLKKLAARRDLPADEADPAS